MVKDGALVFPARPLLEALGYEVGWDGSTAQVTFRREGLEGAFRVGRPTLQAGGKAFNLSAAPVLVDGRAHISLNLLRLAGEDVRWNGSAWTMQVRRPEPVPTAAVEKVEGEAWVVRDGKQLPAVPGTRLLEGDLLETKTGTIAHVVMDDGTRLQIGSKVRINKLKGGKDLCGRNPLPQGQQGQLLQDCGRQVSFKLLSGRVVARVAKQAKKNYKFELETPTGVVGVRGTVFATEVAEDGRSVVAVFSGAVNVISGSGGQQQSVVVKQRQETVLTTADAPPPPPEKIRSITVDPWLQQTLRTALVEEIQDNIVRQIQQTQETLAPPQPGGPGAGEPQPGIDAGALLEQMWQTIDTTLAVPVVPVPDEVAQPGTPPPAPPGQQPGEPSAPSLDLIEQFQDQLDAMQETVRETIKEQVREAFRKAEESIRQKADQQPGGSTDDLLKQLEDQLNKFEETFDQSQADAGSDQTQTEDQAKSPPSSGGGSSDTTAPELTVSVSPETMTAPGAVTIIAQSNESLRTAPSVTVTPPGGGAAQTVTMTTSASVSNAWTGTYSVTSASNDGTYTINAIGSDTAGNEGKKTATFTVALDRTAPSISGQTPANGAKINKARPFISVTVSDTSGIDSASVVLKLDGAKVAHSFNNTTGVVSYAPGDNLAEGLHSLALDVKDTLGNPVTASWSFTVDTAAPALTAATVNGSSLVLTYGELLDAASVPAAADFQVWQFREVSVSVTGVAVSGNTVTLTLAQVTSPGDNGVFVSYTPGSSPIQDPAKNPAAALSREPVANNTGDAPPAFSGVEMAVPSSSTSVDLAWNPATDDITAQGNILYDIGVSTTPGAVFQAVYTTGPGDTSATISGLTPGTTYYVVVRARDAVGNSDGNTRQALVTTPVPRYGLGHTGNEYYNLAGKPTAGVAGGVSFSYNGMNCGEFTLDFGDGTSDTQSCPDGFPVSVDHVYPAPGIYTVNLYEPVQDGGLVESLTLTYGVDAAAPDTTKPVLTSAAVNGATLALNYHEALDPASVPAGGDFTVTVNGQAQAAPTNVAVTGRIVILTLTAAVYATDTVMLSYLPGVHPIRDAAGNPAAALTGRPVTWDATAPRLISATVDGSMLVLTYDEALDAGSVPALADFMIDVAVGESRLGPPPHQCHGVRQHGYAHAGGAGAGRPLGFRDVHAGG